jgi:hypothetical protein
MEAMRALPVTVPAAALLAASLALAAGDTFDYVRYFEPASKGSGVWTGKFAAGTDDLVGVAVAADWWEGPGDLRVGDEKKSAMPDIHYEVKRGDAPWTPLPAAARDLRLTARTVAGAEAKALLGGGPAGEWSVRQTAGGAYPKTVRLEFTCRGDPLMVKDLRVKSLMLPGLDPKRVIGHDYFPDRVENPTLKPGSDVHAVIVVENCGARPTREVDLDLLAVPWGKRLGKRMGFAQVPPLEPGKTAELKIDGKIPADTLAANGNAEVLAVVNPRGAEPEVETWNNALGRGFRFEIPPKKEPLPGDLKDR